MSLNHDLSELFRLLAAILDIKGGNSFRALAFSKVSRILKDMTFDVRQAVENDTLDQIDGIGAGSARIITEYVRTGRSTDYDELAASVPAGLIPLLDIPGLGPKTIALLWKERNITSREDLLKALDSGALAGLKGIGEKKIAAIRQGLAFSAQAQQRMGYVEAFPIAASLVERLREHPAVQTADVAGSLRRGRETIGDVDLVCAVADPGQGAAVAEAFVAFPEVQRILGQGATKASVVTIAGLQVDLRIVPQAHYGAALLYFTGSKDHNVKIRGLAQDQGMTLNEWGLYEQSAYEKAAKTTGQAPDLKPLAARTEADVYRRLGLSYVEPELREDRGEVALAAQDKLPALITLADIKGDLHTHTTASDGVATIEQMADAARALGYEYLAITDHSQAQAIANGLSPQRLLKHVADIRKIGAKLKGITLLAGAEVDILADGRLDYDDDVLAELDFVVASPHVALKQDPAKATDRLLRAIEHPYVNLIGHPTGRIIHRREGLPLDFDRLLPAAAAAGTALEINAGWPRWDLDDVHARAAIHHNVMLSINTDAHATESLPDMRFGLLVARRAAATKKHVLNCLPLPSLRAFLKRKHK